MNSSLHDRITDMREKESRNAILFTVLEDTVTAAGVDTGNEDGIISGKLRLQFMERTVILELILNHVKTLDRFTLDNTKALKVYFITVNEQCLSSGIELKEDQRSEVSPKDIEDKLNSQKDKERYR